MIEAQKGKKITKYTTIAKSSYGGSKMFLSQRSKRSLTEGSKRFSTWKSKRSLTEASKRSRNEESVTKKSK